MPVVDRAGGLKAMHAGIGGSAKGITQVLVGTGSAAVKVWDSRNIAAMDRVNGGDQILSSSNSWIQIGGWRGIANGTLIQGNSLRVSGTGYVRIEIGSQWEGTGIADRDWRLLVNGAVAWTKGAVNATSFTNVIPSLHLTNGSLLAVEGSSSSAFTARRTVLANANTYLRVIPI